MSNINENQSVAKNVINWYPGHMAKTKRLITEKRNMIDVVYELVDARIPYSSKIKDLDTLVKDKPRILILNKYDLCDPVETDKWATYYEQKGYRVIKLDLKNKKNINLIFEYGTLEMKAINQKRINKGLKPRSIRALIVGIPNVGKSTLINRLVGRKATSVANKPGVTQSLSWIRINKDIELLDTPGILWPKFEEADVAFNLACMTAIKEEVLPLDEVALYILKQLATYYPEQLKQRYDIDTIDFDDIIPTYDHIGKKRGCLLKNQEIDYDKVIRIIIHDLRNGYLGRITFDRIKS